MSENHSQESHNMIRILATECENLLQKIIDRCAQTAGKSLFEDYLQRLSAWAAYLGVFARPSQCLDHRLRPAMDARDLVLRSLDSIGRCSTLILRSDTSSQSQVSTPKNVSRSHYRRSQISQNKYEFASTDIRKSQVSLYNNEEDLLEIEDALEQLYRLASVIKGSLRRTYQPGSNELAENTGLVPVDRFLARTIECLYPRIDQSLKGVLSASMSDRFARIMTFNTRQDTLEARYAEQDSQPTILEKDHSEVMKSSESKSQQPRRCEWCGERFNRRYMYPPNWRQHVDHDLRPYICLAEHCTVTVGYPSIGEWSSHMKQHNEFWYRTVYLPPTYICPLCIVIMPPFANRGELLQHLTREHESDAFDYDQLSLIAGQIQGIKERPKEQCLLCGFVIENENPSSQSQSESRREGNTKKRKTKRDQFNPVEDSSSSEDDGGQTHEANNDDCMAYHIAAHLQTLMFLTLRVLAMQKNMDSEGEDVPGSNVGTVDIRDFQDFPHLDYPLSFEDENLQSELAWLPAVEAHYFNFDRQQYQVFRYPTLEREDIIKTSIESPDSSTIQETIVRLEALLATTEQNRDFYNSSAGALESARRRHSSRPSYSGGAYGGGSSSGNSGSLSVWQCCSCGCGWQHVAWSPLCPECEIPRCKECLYM